MSSRDLGAFEHVIDRSGVELGELGVGFWGVGWLGGRFLKVFESRFRDKTLRFCFFFLSFLEFGWIKGVNCNFLLVVVSIGFESAL